MAPQHFLFLLLVNLVWGMATVAVKFSVEQLPPLLATGLRFVMVALVLFPFLKWHPGRMVQVTVLGLLAGGLQMGLMFSGLALSEGVTRAAILTQLNVPLATLLSILLLGEVVHWRRAGGIALAFSGSMLLGFDPEVMHHPLGTVLILGSALAGALTSIEMRRLAGVGVLELQAWIATLSAPSLLLLSALLEKNHMASMARTDWAHYGAVAFTALGSSLIGHGGLFWLLQRYPVSLVSPLTLLSPLVTVAIGIGFMGDQVSGKLIAGGLCIFAGVLIIVLRKPDSMSPTIA